MEMQHSGGSNENAVGGIVTYVFVGTRGTEVADFGGQTLSCTHEGRAAMFSMPADAIAAAVAAVAYAPKQLFAGVASGAYQPSRWSETLLRIQDIAAAGQKGQIVVSHVTHELARPSLSTDYKFHSLGTVVLSNGSAEVLLLAEHASVPFEESPKTVQEPARRRSKFIGRSRELDEVRRLLDASRVVSVLAPSGLGKTALLNRLLSEVDTDFTDGVARLDLSPLAQPALLEPALIRLLEAPKLAGEDHLEALKAYLRPRRFLLILDNAEHLLNEVRRIVTALSETCPELAILIGSHRPLRLPDEAVFRLEGLELPSIAEDWRVMQDYDAVALFVDRAQAVDIRFCITAENASDVANLCRRLDGIPLAIELAASKTKALSPRQILGRLDDYRFELLKDADPTRPERQKNLEATVHLGYASLREESRALLRRLSVFHGAFTVDQAIQVCSDSHLTPENVFASFEELVDGSMLSASSTSGNEKRFHLLETIRAYGRERLREHREQESLSARHRLWCADFAAKAETGLTGRDQAQWLGHLDASYEDIRSVIEWHLTRRGDAATAIRMLLSIYPFFFARQCLHEGLRLTAKIVRTPSAADSPELARALNLASIFATRIADEESARAYAIASVRQARRANDLSMLARARNSLAFIAQDAGRLVRARRHLLGALAAFRTLGEETNELKLLINVAALESTIGLLNPARTHLDEAAQLLSRIEDPMIRASYLQNAAHLALAERLPIRALGFLRQTMELQIERQDVDGLATCLRNCAYAHEMLGYFIEAALFIGAAKGIGLRVEQHAFEYEAEPFRALVCRTTEALGQETYTALTFEGGRMKVPDLLTRITETLNATFR